MRFDPSYVHFFTIYQRPNDFPDTPFVVRPSMVFNGNLKFHHIACLCDSLEQAREPIKDWCIHFDRHALDDPVIVECWVW